MMTGDGPKLLEYNVRFGDPETQAILIRLETDLTDICDSILSDSLADLDILWSPGNSACVVLASDGYPVDPRVGDPITGLDKVAATRNVEIFHAGTSGNASSGYQTSGGRVLGVTGVADSLQTALAATYSAVSKITFKGMQYRRDIGR
jgi:phosphoribosylamine--glycine ligase